jgi:hypothetical protein
MKRRFESRWSMAVEPGEGLVDAAQGAQQHGDPEAVLRPPGVPPLQLPQTHFGPVDPPRPGHDRPCVAISPRQARRGASVPLEGLPPRVPLEGLPPR